jgi:hypothetical protein
MPDIQPVVFGYLRPESTLQVINLAYRATSTVPLLSLDGPRTPEEGKLQETLINCIEDKYPGIEIRRQDRNIGCRSAIMDGMSWAMQVSAAEYFIFLEDDCIPSIDFFDFVQENVFALTSDVLLISGTNPCNQTLFSSPILSSYPLIHGWAISKEKLNLMIQRVCSSDRHSRRKDIPLKARVFWKLTCLKVEAGTLDTWDAHWMRTSWSFPERILIPNFSLINNIGSVSTRESSSKSRNYQLAPKQRKAAQHGDITFDDWLLSEYFRISYIRLIVWVPQVAFFWIAARWKKLGSKRPFPSKD